MDATNNDNIRQQIKTLNSNQLSNETKLNWATFLHNARVNLNGILKSSQKDTSIPYIYLNINKHIQFRY